MFILKNLDVIPKENGGPTNLMDQVFKLRWINGPQRTSVVILPSQRRLKGPTLRG
eukprot:CCRYP_008923-RA/>CCRYP_008923-RA protein AED:0.46 eAED:0.97 QI:80/0/0/1/0/0/3/118/54